MHTLRHPTESRWVMLIVTSILCGLFLVALTGCPINPDLVHNSTPAVGSAINKAESHVGSAEALVQQAKPEASKTGQALLDAASKEHKAADAELHTAAQENAAVQAERDKLAKAAAEAKAAESEVEHSIGYQIQLWVMRFLRIVAACFILHFLLGGLSVILPIIFPVTAVAAPLLHKLGALCNPGAWFQSIVDHVHLKRCQNGAGQGSFTLPPIP